MAGDFDESQHPRADDGKFGAGGGDHSKSGKAESTIKRGKAIIASHAEATKLGRDAKALSKAAAAADSPESHQLAADAHRTAAQAHKSAVHRDSQYDAEDHENAAKYHDFSVERSRYITSLTPSQRDAALSYSSHYYTNINGWLRDGMSEHRGSEMKDLVSHLDSAIDKSRTDKDMTVYRSGGRLGGTAYKHYAGLAPGDMFSDKAYLSTTAKSNAADQFPFGVKIEIAVPKGSRAAAIPSEKPHEAEVLLPRGAKLRVDKIEYDDSNIFEGSPDKHPYMKVRATLIDEGE